MEIPIYTVDAFTNEAFKGNPAAVCLLTEPRSAEWMQQVAAELNLSETAYLTPRAEGDGYSLRWFTPAIEVPLCGHATLASAHVLWETGRLAPEAAARFCTLSGWLLARRDGQRIEMDFPALGLSEIEVPDLVVDSLGALPSAARLVGDQNGNDKNYLVELAGEATVRALRPDFARMRAGLDKGVIATARATTPGFDFVSRYFATYAGIDEDPVTGSAHCALAPYWAAKLGKPAMVGYQASARGGVVGVELRGERVLLRGEAVTIWRGALLH
jgi:predicted PhzF superfamily epimerase YddE/YHI9